MTNNELARSYLFKAGKRLKVLDPLVQERDFSDVIREAQEVVERAQKALLRQVGIDPPKCHEVSDILLAHQEFFPEAVRGGFEVLAPVAKWLRKERELSFYGDTDFIPTEEYSEEDALRAMEGANKWVELAERVARDLESWRGHPVLRCDPLCLVGIENGYFPIRGWGDPWS